LTRHLSWLQHENGGSRRDVGFRIEKDKEKKACISNEKGRRKRKKEREGREERRQERSATKPPHLEFSNHIDFALFALFFSARATL
jgi:hypothetical protein